MTFIVAGILICGMALFVGIGEHLLLDKFDLEDDL